MEEYKTVGREAHDSFTEQRSKFIGYAKPVQTEEDALNFIEKIRSKHWDAKHNVYAYALRSEHICRYSDDGEPHGTGGQPVLDVIQKSGITDTVVVVTRYFGGILLGTGGLVRAYSQGAKAALKAAGIVTMRPEFLYSLRCDYNQYGRIAALIPSFGGDIDDTDFSDAVTVSFHVPQSQSTAFLKALADLARGSLTPEETGKAYFAAKDKT